MPMVGAGRVVVRRVVAVIVAVVGMMVVGVGVVVRRRWRRRVVVARRSVVAVVGLGAGGSEAADRCKASRQTREARQQAHAEFPFATPIAVIFRAQYGGFMPQVSAWDSSGIRHPAYSRQYASIQGVGRKVWNSAG